MRHYLYIFPSRFCTTGVMTLDPVIDVLPTGEARAALSPTLDRFRREGVTAVPVVFGSHRKPEGVVQP
jgi:hypothetical protein